MSLQKIIIDQLENKNQPLLHRLAADKEYFEEFSKYVEKNLKVDLEKFINAIYKSSGGNINLRDDNNETALYPAFENRNYDMIRILKLCGADIGDFKKEINERIKEATGKIIEISLNNTNNVSRITRAARDITNVRGMHRYLDVNYNTKAFIAACAGSFGFAMIINAIKSNYYNGTYVPITNHSSDNFVIDRVNTFVGLALGIIAYKTIQALPEIAENISDLWHRRLESRHNQSQVSRYQEIRNNIMVSEVAEHISYAVKR